MNIMFGEVALEISMARFGTVGTFWGSGIVFEAFGMSPGPDLELWGIWVPREAI